MSASGSPHHAVREDWLALTPEAALSPGQPILDAHHHLWDRPGSRYLGADFLADAGAGHDVRASVYVQCRTGYREQGPEALRPVGEVETIRRWCAGQPCHPAALVAMADLQLGDQVRPVLDALIEAGEGRVRAIRNTTAHHPHPDVRSNPNPAPDGLMRSPAFRRAAAALPEHGLCLDVWAYQTQLDEVYALARALPNLTVVIDHCGGPLGVGPFKRNDAVSHRAWRSSLARVAGLENTRIKIGGFGLSVLGYEYAQQPAPPDSQALAADWRPTFETCIELFGTGRAMFESNFPVDKGQFSYTVLWNAFKRLAGDLEARERDDLFWRTAARCYGIDEERFSNHNRSTVQ
ncbi:MAG: amidohydrolase family protein [Burkholderiaceae bacterium]